MHHHSPQMAIIFPNFLVALGLKSILEKIIEGSEIEIFTSFEEFTQSNPSRFSHHFVSHAILESQASFFASQPFKTILMATNQEEHSNIAVASVNVCHSEEAIVHEILKLRSHSHHHSHSIGHQNAFAKESEPLTMREKEVLGLIAQGFMNKEIADKMNISIATVISHRKNLVSKLSIKSVAGLTIYAIKSGLVEL